MEEKQSKKKLIKIILIILSICIIGTTGIIIFNNVSNGNINSVTVEENWYPIPEEYEVLTPQGEKQSEKDYFDGLIPTGQSGKMRASSGVIGNTAYYNFYRTTTVPNKKDLYKVKKVEYIGDTVVVTLKYTYKGDIACQGFSYFHVKVDCEKPVKYIDVKFE